MMREKIYEIPVNEAFDTDCECPLCVLEQNLEKNTVEFILGPAMMEPDFREETNKNGFCKHHYELLFAQTNRLSLALVLDTHLDEIIRLLDKNAPLSKSPNTEAIKKGLNELEHSCSACQKNEFIMKKYLDVIFYMWKHTPEFQKKVSSCKGLCLKHLKRLLDDSTHFLSKKEAAQFCQQVLELEREQLKRIKQEVNWFTKKFDYKNEKEPWGNSKDAPKRTIEKLVGSIKKIDSE